MKRRAVLVTWAVLGFACGDDDVAPPVDGGGIGADSTLAADATPDGAVGEGDAGASSPLDPVDRAALEAVSELYALFEARAADVWAETGGNTYRFDEIPLYLVRRDGEVTSPRERGFLLNAPAVPSGATPVTDTLPANLGTVLRYDGALDAFGEEYFDFMLDVAGSPTLAFAFGLPGSDGDDTASPMGSQFREYLVHEGFHRFQTVEAAWPEPEAWFAIDPELYPLTEGFLALTLLESRILGRALDAASLDTMAAERALRQLAAVRAARAALPEARVDGVNAADYDSAGEEVEGTARYIEAIVHALLSGGASPFDREYASMGDLGPLDAYVMTRADALDYFGQGRTYSTGAAIGHLLDVVGQDWHDDVAGASTPFDVVRTHFAPANDMVRDTLVMEAKTEHAFDTAIVPEARSLSMLM